MKVITTNRDVIYSSANGDYYYNTEGPDSTAKQVLASQKQDTTKRKIDWTKAKENALKFGTFLKDSGALNIGQQILADKYGVKKPMPKNVNNQNTNTQNTTTSTTAVKSKPMSTGVKVAIGVGIAAVLGFVIYKVTKRK